MLVVSFTFPILFPPSAPSTYLSLPPDFLLSLAFPRHSVPCSVCPLHPSNTSLCRLPLPPKTPQPHLLSHLPSPISYPPDPHTPHPLNLLTTSFLTLTNPTQRHNLLLSIPPRPLQEQPHLLPLSRNKNPLSNSKTWSRLAKVIDLR
jgi:hypothetical protein